MESENHDTKPAGALGTPSSPADTGSLFAFVSFDLVNSTRYKNTNTVGWPFVVRRFYEAVIDGMTKWSEGFRVWKYVGDEVLLFKHISRPDQLRQCIEAPMEVILSVTATIHSEFTDSRKLLAVKGTVWCARVGDFTSRQNDESGARRRPPNLVFRSSGGGEGQIDFLGPDIDAGFRISKHTMRLRLVVSAEFAFLLYLSRGLHGVMEKRLKIVSYEVLKGVWDDRRYPIVWYERDWDKVASTFLYDEQFDSEIVRRIIDKGTPLGSLEELVKVFEDHDRHSDIQEQWEDLNKGRLTNEGTILGRAKGLTSQVEVHCVAVCFRHDGRVLVARRPAQKRRYAGLWEFGCGQLAEGETFAECLQRNYRADFGVELDFGGVPRPIQSYVIPDAEATRSIPGVVFVATVRNPTDAKATKHSAIDWLDPSRLPPDIDATFVPASRERMRLAVEAYRSMNTAGG